MSIYKKWRLLDELFLKLRYGKVIKHVPKGGVVADFGCGREAVFLKKIAGKISRGIGIDLQLDNRGSTSIKVGSNLDLIAGDLENRVPLEDESVDMVSALAILEHLSHPKVMLKEAYRILKPGGLLVMTVPTWIQKPIVEFLAFRLHLISEEAIADHKRYYWKGELEPMLTEAGFKKENTKIKYFELGVNNFVLARK